MVESFYKVKLLAATLELKTDFARYVFRGILRKFSEEIFSVNITHLESCFKACSFIKIISVTIPYPNIFSWKQLSYPYGPKQNQNKWGQNKMIRLKVSILRHIQEVLDCNRFCGESTVFMSLRIEHRNWNNKTYKLLIIFNFINPGTFKKITLLAVNLLYFTFAICHHRWAFITWGVELLGL